MNHIPPSHFQCTHLGWTHLPQTYIHCIVFSFIYTKWLAPTVKHFYYSLHLQQKPKPTFNFGYSDSLGAGAETDDAADGMWIHFLDEEIKDRLSILLDEGITGIPDRGWQEAANLLQDCNDLFLDLQRSISSY